MDAVTTASRPHLAAPRRLLRLRSDGVLAERFAHGDELAFAVLYERHRASVIAVCMGVLGSRHDAEDAAQEAFTSLAQSLRVTRPANIAAWLTRVARNAAIDLARRRRDSARSDAEPLDRPIGGEGVRAELDSVMAGLRELPESQRTALLMRELAGHSYREIASLLEVDEEAVRGLIARARVNLRAHRAATEMLCATARAALALEPDGRGGHDRAVRRHVRVCASCRAYRRALRRDARALNGLVPAASAPLAGGGAVFGSLAAKSALLGGVLTQVTAACAVSACAVGGVVLLSPIVHHQPAPTARAHLESAAAVAGRRSPTTKQTVLGAAGSGATRDAREATTHATMTGASAAGARSADGSSTATRSPASRRTAPGATAPGRGHQRTVARSSGGSGFRSADTRPNHNVSPAAGRGAPWHPGSPPQASGSDWRGLGAPPNQSGQDAPPPYRDGSGAASAQTGWGAPSAHNGSAAQTGSPDPLYQQHTAARYPNTTATGWYRSSTEQAAAHTRFTGQARPGSPGVSASSSPPPARARLRAAAVHSPARPLVLVRTTRGPAAGSGVRSRSLGS